MGRLTKNFPVTKVTIKENPATSSPQVYVDQRADTVVVEEPLEIRVNGQVVTTTMRTPGNDIELAHGFLFSEGIIESAQQIAEARYCAGATVDGINTYNVLDLDVLSPSGTPTFELNPDFIRTTTTTSACGVCGTTSIDQLMGKKPYEIEPITLSPSLIDSLPAKLRDSQKIFKKTGGIHAAGAFTSDGELLVAREDIGRHNAADKVIGHLLMEEKLPARDIVLVMSSRASFELVQKAIMAGIPALVAVSAPSSLAIDLAKESGMLLTGFTRPGRFNLYSGELS